MAKSAKTKEAAAEGAEGKPKGGKRKLLFLALPVVLLLAGGGAWFAGLLPFGGGSAHAEAEEGGEAHEAAAPAAHGDAHGASAKAEAGGKNSAFFDMPDIMANLNVPGRRNTFIRLRSKLQLTKPTDAEVAQAQLPKLLDIFQTYLREMRPEELRGSTGTQRLREELIARANIALAPVKVGDVLFTEILVQ
ncbi:flagellar basal body-associated FliL family protein [Roseomonas elaeocarpi]|uniref:Flagellar protein FliL n=1 Tax=Roseomonas elaeocarpi TaxID=907779 RepID=A0ABV6JPH3_9PROT